MKTGRLIKMWGFASSREQVCETEAQMAEISKFQENCTEYSQSEKETAEPTGFVESGAFGHI